MKTIAILILATLLAACGGGGDDELEDGHRTIGAPDCSASAACR